MRRARLFFTQTSEPRSDGEGDAAASAVADPPPLRGAGQRGANRGGREETAERAAAAPGLGGRRLRWAPPAGGGSGGKRWRCLACCQRLLRSFGGSPPPRAPFYRPSRRRRCRRAGRCRRAAPLPGRFCCCRLGSGLRPGRDGLSPTWREPLASPSLPALRSLAVRGFACVCFGERDGGFSAACAQGREEGGLFWAAGACGKGPRQPRVAPAQASPVSGAVWAPQRGVSPARFAAACAPSPEAANTASELGFPPLK